ncbi:Hypothetical predicted protein [Olea europaea subsp. europaea]|uniref:Uncharacterized protein n=1 Tax=Olea europaea subsp. europaea TaxID=158383 RepID=A0A8S0S509_OLEEU|nr:Hypothetical predicted protein [Olea europaea subsp. europaea]
MATPLWHNSGAYPAPRVPQQLKLEEDSEPSEATTTAPASTAFDGGYGSHGGGGSTGARSWPSVQSNTKSCPWSGEIKGDRDRVACRSQRRFYGSLSGSGTTGGRSWPSVQSNTQLYLVRRDQGGSRWPPSPMLDLGPVFSLTRRVVLNPPRSRGNEIEWHGGRNACATGASVAVGAPGLDHGPVFNTETKGGSSWRGMLVRRSRTVLTTMEAVLISRILAKIMELLTVTHQNL